MDSMTDAASGVCGFKVYTTQDGIALAAEWTHSLNMLEIDISSMYEDACESLTAADNGAVDVVVSCDSTYIYIGFFVNLRNATQYKHIDSVSAFYGMENNVLANVIISARVWEDIKTDGRHAILHTDKHSTSFSFQFSQWQDNGHTHRTKHITGFVLLWAVAALLLAASVLIAWNGANLDIICQHVVPIIFPGEEEKTFCRRGLPGSNNNGFFS